MPHRALTHERRIPADFLLRWNHVLLSLSEVFDAQVACVVRRHPTELEVVAANNEQLEGFQIGQTFKLDHGPLCQAIVQQDCDICIENLSEAHGWDTSILIQSGLASFQGTPVHWPDGKSFGMLCVMDANPLGDNIRHKDMLQTFRLLIQNELHLLVEMDEHVRLNKLFEGKKAELDEFNKELVRKEKRIKELKSKLELQTGHPV